MRERFTSAEPAWAPSLISSLSHIDNNFGSGGVGANDTTGINHLHQSPASINVANPAQAITEFRRCVLGYDISCGGYSNLVGLPTWNRDAAATKDAAFFEGALRQDFGTGQHPETTEFSLRIHF